EAPFAKALVDIRKYFPADVGMKLDSVLVTVPVPQQVLGDTDPPSEDPVILEDKPSVKKDVPEEAPIIEPPPTIELSKDDLYQPEDFQIVAQVGDVGPKFSVIVETASDMREVLS